MQKTVSIIVPIYNEEASLSELLKQLESTAERVEKEFSVLVSYIFIDDGSADNSFDILKSWDFGPRSARLLQFSRNFGKEAALSAGITTAANADAAILMDADLQHPPEMILQFLRIWQEKEVDSVYAYKANRRKSEGFVKALLSKLFYKIINHGNRYEITPDAGDFRLINRRFISALSNLGESERFMKGLYSWIGFKQVGIPFVASARTQGKSSFNVLRLFTMTLDAITSFTTAPLRLMALFGGIVAVISLIYGCYIIIEHIFFPSVPTGITSVLALTAFFGGAQFLFLGLLGEYIGKAVLEAKKRPPYLVAESIVRERKNDANSR